MTTEFIDRFIDSQLALWPEAAERHNALTTIQTKQVTVGETLWNVQYNPSRSISTRAKIDNKSIKSRQCFLCHRPDVQQSLHLDRGYDALVNPYPIFPGHLTIVSATHTPQLIVNRIGDIAWLATEFEGHTVFYNGARCGASAPDHAHFQAVRSVYLPIVRHYPFETHYFIGSSDEVSASAEMLLNELHRHPDEQEPRVNIAARAIDKSTVELIVIPRRAHRPTFYDDIHISPGAIDMLGTIIATDGNEFDRIDSDILQQTFSQVAFDVSEPEVRVGIVTAPAISYELNGRFLRRGDTFIAHDDNCRFTLHDVTIGIGFHWEQKEDQTFPGSLQLMRHDDSTTTAVNIVKVEDYLTSVISSEMSATASIELLKAHAVISRSWLLAQMKHKTTGHECEMPADTDSERVKWYDHDDHDDFDVCADDHCQRYQGLTRACREAVRSAVMATRGEVLLSGGELCDARFSKCCGGAFEEFENCWEPVHHNYLETAADTDPQPAVMPDLNDESQARKWIMGRPDAFCATQSSEILHQVLNDYDQSTHDFYRWRVDYTTDELSQLLAKRSGIDFGTIKELRPLARGTSGRIYRLLIVGSRRSMTVGKELEIRRWLSPTHLYSSAFVVDSTPNGFTLHGAGWGHGVGLCQIGAAVMAANGYNYRQILSHYFHNATISRIY